jgi:hypothetical protein
MPVPVFWQNFLSVWQNCLYIELPVPLIRKNHLYVDSVPVIWQNCRYIEEHASDLADLHVPVIWQNCLYVDSVVPVIWQNCLYVEECASDLAECLSQ